MLLAKVKNTVKRYGLLEKGDRVIVAVSGGPDSTALLFALNELKHDYILKLYIAHFDHMFRGAQEAKKDSEYVSALSAKLKLPLIFGSSNVPKYAQEAGLSLEEAAREKRYEFLLKTAAETGATKIALGHTLDDQAETVLMRLIRGAGLGGLRGIPPSRKMYGRSIIRPLIEVWRSDVEAYLRGLNIRPRQDITNMMTQFLRNRIRLELIPYLKKYNPNIKELLVKNAQGLAYDYEVLAGSVDREFARCAGIKAGVVEIPLDGLKKRPVGIQRGILRRAIESVKGNLRGIDYSHIEDIESLLKADKGALDLPGEIRVTKTKDRLLVHKIKRNAVVSLRFRRRFSVPGRTFVPELNASFDAKFVKNRVQSHKPASVEYLDYGRLTGPLYIRGWDKGDRFKPLGMEKEKKLQDFYVDEKVKRNKRDHIPLVVSGNRIIWVCGLRLSDDVKVTSKTGRILRLSYRRMPVR